MHKLTKRGVFYVSVFLLFAILLTWYLLGGKPHIYGLFRDGAYGTAAELDSSFTYAMQKYNGGVALFGKDGVLGISNSGQKAWEVDFPCTDPLLSASGRYILAAERGGQSVKLIRGRKVIYDMKTDGEIITVSVNKKGTFAVVTKERGYKGRLQVFSPRGKELYAWHSAEQNILAAAVSEDNKKIAVSVVNMQEPGRLSAVYQFDMKETAPRILDVGSENAVSNLLYNGTLLLALGDEGLYGYDAKGTQKFKIDYEGRELQKFSFYSGGILALGLGGGAESGSLLKFYDMRGTEKGACPIDGEIFGLDTFGRYAAVSTRDGVLVARQNGDIVDKKEMGAGAQNAFLCGSRNRVFLRIGTSARMHIL